MALIDGWHGRIERLDAAIARIREYALALDPFFAGLAVREYQAGPLC